MGIPIAMIVFTAGTTIASADTNSNFANLYNVLNGNVDDANIKVGAAINWSKLAASTGRNIVFGTTYGITSDVVLGNNWIQQYNVSLPAPMSVTGSKVIAYNTTVVAGAWANRTTANICVAYVSTSTGLEQMWYAASAGIGVAPSWVKAYEINLATGAATITGGLSITGAVTASTYVQAGAGFRPSTVSTSNNIFVPSTTPTSVTITHNYGYVIIPVIWFNTIGAYAYDMKITANTINSFTITFYTTGGSATINYGYAY